MKRRPNRPGREAEKEESKEILADRLRELQDPDPTVNFPQWLRSLLLLLDYAIIEGLQHNLPRFVHHLELAEQELADVLPASDETKEENRISSKTH
ncbi:MAG: hypothetical protein AAF405_08315 [Pseudomonadota bacterium]